MNAELTGSTGTPSNTDFLSLVRSRKPKSLIIKHMQQYLEMDKSELDSKEKVVSALLNIIANENSNKNIDFPLTKVDLIVTLDKLSLLSSLFFNIKVIICHNLMNMQEEISEELCSLRAGMEFLLLGLEGSQTAYSALAIYLKHLDKLQNAATVDIVSLKMLEFELKKIIENNALEIFQGIQKLNAQGIKVRYLLSDILFESLLSF